MACGYARNVQKRSQNEAEKGSRQKARQIMAKIKDLEQEIEALHKKIEALELIHKQQKCEHDKILLRIYDRGYLEGMTCQDCESCLQSRPAQESAENLNNIFLGCL